MTLIKKRQELPVFGDMMANLFDDKFFLPNQMENMRQTPSVNIFEGPKDFTIQLAAPGMKKEDFKIDLKRNQLSISATSENSTEKTEKTYSLREFNINSFKRTFNLPKNINQEGITAQYHDGILEVKIEKKETINDEIKTIEIN